MKTKALESLPKIVLTTVLFVFHSFAMNAQTVLDEYVKEGLKSNLLVQQKKLFAACRPFSACCNEMFFC